MDVFRQPPKPIFYLFVASTSNKYPMSHHLEKEWRIDQSVGKTNDDNEVAKTIILSRNKSLVMIFKRRNGANEKTVA